MGQEVKDSLRKKIRKTRYSRVLKRKYKKTKNTRKNIKRRTKNTRKNIKRRTKNIKRRTKNIKRNHKRFKYLQRGGKLTREPRVSKILLREIIKHISDNGYDEHGQLPGDGGSGIILRVTNKASRQKLALKVIQVRWKDWQSPDEAVAEVDKEVSMQQNLGIHPFVPTIYGILPDLDLGDVDLSKFGININRATDALYKNLDEGYVTTKFVLMDEVYRGIAPDGAQDLMAVLDSVRVQKKDPSLTNDGVKWSERVNPVKEILAQVVLAVEIIHEKGVIHRDLKPENIMVGPHPNHEDKMRVYIIDYGLAERVNDDGKVIDEDESLVEVDLIRPCGTFAFIAPEILGISDSKGRVLENYDMRDADIWSLGCLIWESAFGSANPDLYEIITDEENEATARKTLGFKKKPTLMPSAGDLWLLAPELIDKYGQGDVRPYIEEVKALVKKCHPDGASMKPTTEYNSTTFDAIKNDPYFNMNPEDWAQLQTQMEEEAAADAPEAPEVALEPAESPRPEVALEPAPAPSAQAPAAQAPEAVEEPSPAAQAPEAEVALEPELEPEPWSEPEPAPEPAAQAPEPEGGKGQDKTIIMCKNCKKEKSVHFFMHGRSEKMAAPVTGLAVGEYGLCQECTAQRCDVCYKCKSDTDTDDHSGGRICDGCFQTRLQGPGSY